MESITLGLNERHLSAPSENIQKNHLLTPRNPTHCIDHMSKNNAVCIFQILIIADHQKE